VEDEQGQTPEPLEVPRYPTRRRWLIGLAAAGVAASAAGLAVAYTAYSEPPRLGGVPLRETTGSVDASASRRTVSKSATRTLPATSSVDASGVLRTAGD
jgi:hypothetical protein